MSQRSAATPSELRRRMNEKRAKKLLKQKNKKKNKSSVASQISNNNIDSEAKSVQSSTTFRRKQKIPNSTARRQRDNWEEEARQRANQRKIEAMEKKLKDKKMKKLRKISDQKKQVLEEGDDDLEVEKSKKSGLSHIIETNTEKEDSGVGQISVSIEKMEEEIEAVEMGVKKEKSMKRSFFDRSQNLDDHDNVKNKKNSFENSMKNFHMENFNNKNFDEKQEDIEEDLRHKTKKTMNNDERSPNKPKRTQEIPKREPAIQRRSDRLKNKKKMEEENLPKEDSEISKNSNKAIQDTELDKNEEQNPIKIKKNPITERTKSYEPRRGTNLKKSKNSKKQKKRPKTHKPKKRKKNLLTGQKEPTHKIPLAPFKRILKEIIHEQNPEMRVTAEAFDFFKALAEMNLVKVFEQGNEITLNSKRVTLMPRDLRTLFRNKGIDELALENIN